MASSADAFENNICQRQSIPCIGYDKVDSYTRETYPNGSLTSTLLEIYTISSSAFPYYNSMFKASLIYMNLRHTCFLQIVYLVFACLCTVSVL